MSSRVTEVINYRRHILIPDVQVKTHTSQSNYRAKTSGTPSRATTPGSQPRAEGRVPRSRARFPTTPGPGVAELAILWRLPSFSR